jgi:type III restriction enzyme
VSGFEVPEPIISKPYDEPAEHWHIVEGETPRRLPGRRPATYY